MAPITRRQTLGMALAAPFMSTISDAAPDQGLFDHGVASGDPDHQSVVIWTRLTTEKNQAKVLWQVSESPDFNTITQQGESITDISRDFTVKVLVTGLRAGKRYFYRFNYDQTFSPVGRTRTLPEGHIKSAAIALVSCSNYPFGFFNAYDAIAKDPDIEFVLHTGDYLYEYGADGWGAATGKRLNRVHVPEHEIISLADYRLRHAQYKRDPASKAMLANHPLLLLWDDHESANNPWVGGAQNHQPEFEGDWSERRAAATQAYYEWMPIREPELESDRLHFWRRYVLGDLATLVTVESRHTGRAQQIEYDSYVTSIKTMQDAKQFENRVLNQADRPMLSPEMQQFLQQAMIDSRAKLQPWRILGNAIPMAKVRVPNLRNLGISMPTDAQADGPNFVWKGDFGLPLYLDTWDGYPWAREEFYQNCQQNQIRDLLVLTGDSHSFWSNQLCDNHGKPMGIEIGTAGVTSPGDFIEQGFDIETSRRLDQALIQYNDEVRWTDNLHQGYVKLVLSHQQVDVEFVAMSTVLSTDYTTTVIRHETITNKNGNLKFV